jgi:hypothetical protein
VVKLHGKVIILFVVCELLLAKNEDLRKATEVLFFVFVSSTCFLDDEGLSLFRCVFLALSRHHPILDFFVPLRLHLLLPLIVDIEDIERICNQAFLDVAVERSVGCEAGRVVDLEEVGIEFVVDHDVEAQDLEAHIVGEVVRVD